MFFYKAGAVMSSVLNGLQITLFLLVIISVPILIFFSAFRDFSARKWAELAVGLILLVFLLFYNAGVIIQFIVDHQFYNPVTNHLVDFLYSFRVFVLDHWPRLGGIRIFGITFFSMIINNQFTPIWWLPLGILWLGSLARFVIVQYVPNNTLRVMAHEYWLYITSFLILLIIISNVLDWNVFITFAIILFAFLLVAAGLYRIVTDPFIVIFEAIRHLGRFIGIGIVKIRTLMRRLARLAVRIAKFFYRVFKNIRQFYKDYVQQPFINFHNWLINVEKAKKQKAMDELFKVTEEMKHEGL